MEEILNKLIELAKAYGKLEIEKEKYEQQSKTFYEAYTRLQKEAKEKTDGKV